MCSHETVTPQAAVKLEFDEQYTEIDVAEAEDLELQLTVRAKDEQGNPYFRESSLVRFIIEGDAEILAVDNGNLMGSEPYGEHFMHMYHGCVSVLVRLKGMPGRVAVHAFADGMHSGAAYIDVKGNAPDACMQKTFVRSIMAGAVKREL